MLPCKGLTMIASFTYQKKQWTAILEYSGSTGKFGYLFKVIKQK